MRLEADGLTMKFGEETVLQDVSFAVESGETLAILGRSGSGKTTLLKILAGLETAEAGGVKLGSQDITHRPPQDRGIVYLYQEALLFPHLDIFENVAFGLRLRNMPAHEIDSAVRGMLAELGLKAHGGKRPEALSGGQRQRAAFGRALVIRPKILLLDEPFGALDSATRVEMQSLYRRLAQAHGITSVLVTHDLKEALSMGNRIALMDQGRVKTYKSRLEVIKDQKTGLASEISFWQGLTP